MPPIRLLPKPQTQRARTYLFPHVCFGCRKTFRKPPSKPEAPCPQCAKPMTMLNRKFSSPKQRDTTQWEKVQQLVELGFYFFSVYRTGANGKKISVPYPENVAQVPEFAHEFESQSALSRLQTKAKTSSKRDVPPSDA